MQALERATRVAHDDQPVEHLHAVKARGTYGDAAGGQQERSAALVRQVVDRERTHSIALHADDGRITASL